MPNWVVDRVHFMAERQNQLEMPGGTPLVEDIRTLSADQPPLLPADEDDDDDDASSVDIDEDEVIDENVDGISLSEEIIEEEA